MVHTVAVRRRTPALTAFCAGLLLVAACSHDGRTLAPIRPGQTTTTTVVPAIGATADGSTALTLVTDAVADGGELPAKYTCYGERSSPPLRWANVPADATQLALVVRDRDAGGAVHWMVTGIDPTTQGFGEGGVPEGAVEQANQTGAIGWDAPCPPAGTGRHIYDVVLHVLTHEVDIDPAEPADLGADAVESASEAEVGLALTVTPPAAGVGSTEN
jgi:Raf kinase inhibitor-like YbhB/YbcL family protein